jgi:UDP-N-acetylmuramyl pentapeptide synthase
MCVPAIPGFLADRHEHAEDAIMAGAAALVVDMM